MENLLIEREKRIIFQKKIIKKYDMPLVFFRVNYPGLDKINETTREILKIAYVDFNKALNEKVHLRLYNETPEGPNYTALMNCDAHFIKNKAVEFEETHPLGRLVDIDIFDLDGRSISRSDLKLPLRKCFLCSKDVFVCMREEKHTKQEIIDYINDLYLKFLSGS